MQLALNLSINSALMRYRQLGEGGGESTYVLADYVISDYVI